MAIPEKGDPRRPLHLAAASCRILGVLGILAAICIGAFLAPMMARVNNAGLGIVFILLALFYAGGGTAYLVFSIYLKRRRYWAVVAALVLTGVTTLLMSVAVVMNLITFIATGQNRNSPPGNNPMIGLVIAFLVLVALIQLIVHLTQSFEAIKFDPPGAGESRGFEVLPTNYPPT